jgi:hypothetical protein
MGHQRLCHVRVCAVPGEASNILWYVLRFAYAALLMNVSMSAGSSELSMSISEVRIVGLRFYAMLLLCMCVKLHLNIAPVSYIKIAAPGYFYNKIFVN